MAHKESGHGQGSVFSSALLENCLNGEPLKQREPLNS